MSKVVDQHVVEMRFDNRQFESGVKESLTSLEKLKKSLEFSDSSKGLEKVGAAAKNIGLEQMGNSIDNISNKFSAMGVVGFTVLQNLTNAALDFAKNAINKVTGPIINGGISRATNVEKAKFQLEGLHIAWKDIEEDINHGVRDTAYGLDAAANVAAQLVTSGVQLGDNMKNALRGISGVAAMTNSTYEDIGQIFTAVAGAGKVTGDTLMRLSVRGMNAAAKLGEYLHKSEGDIRKMVSKGQIDFQTFADAMDFAFGEHAKDANETFTGVISNIKAALARIGADFVAPVIESRGPVVQFLKSVKNLINDIHKGTTPIAEHFGQGIKTIATRAMEFVDAIDRAKITNMLSGIERAIVNIGRAVASYIVPIKEAFNLAFPKTAADNITSVSDAISDITSRLKLNATGMKALAETFRGVLDIVALVRDTILGIVKALFPVLSQFNSLTEIILVFTAAIGRALTKFAQMVRESGALDKVAEGIAFSFKMVAAAILLVLNLFGKLIDKIKTFRKSGKVVEETTKMVENYGKKASESTWKVLENTEKLNTSIDETSNKALSLSERVRGAFSTVAGVFGTLGSNFKTVINNFRTSNSLTEGFSKTIGLFKNNVNEANRSLDETESSGKSNGFIKVLTKIAETIKAVINIIQDLVKTVDWSFIALAAFTAGIITLIWNIAGAIVNLRRFTASATNLLRAFTNKITGKSRRINPNTLVDIAVGLTMLAVSLKLLSTISPDRLNSVVDAMKNMAVILGGLYLVTRAIDLFAGYLVKNDFVSSFKSSSFEMLAIAAAIVVLVNALQKLDGLELNNIASDVLAVGGIAIALAFAAGVMHRLTPGAAKGAFTVLALAIGIKTIVKALAGLDQFDLNKIDGDIIKFMGIMTGLSILAAGIGRIGASSAIAIVGFIFIWKKFKDDLLDIFSNMSWEEVAKSIVTLDSIIAGLGVVLLALDILAKKYGGGIKSVGLGLIGISVAFGIISLVCYAIRKVQISDLWTGIAILGVLTVITSVLAAFSERTKDSKFLQFAAGMVLMGLVFAEMTALAYVISNTIKNGWAFVGALAVIGAFTVMISLLMEASSMTGNAKWINILAIIAGLSVIFIEMAILSYIIRDEGATNMLLAASAMGIVIAAIGVAGGIIKKVSTVTSTKDVALVGEVILGLVVIATSLIKLSEVIAKNPAAVLEAMLALGSMLAVLYGVMFKIKDIDGRKFGSNKFKATLIAIGMLSAIAISLAGLTAVVTKTNGYGALILSLVSMASLMILMEKVVATMSGLKVSTHLAGTLLSMATVFMAIGISLRSLAEVPWYDLIAPTLAMGAVLFTFGTTLSMVSSSYKTGNASMWSTVLASAVMLVAIGGTLTLLSTQNWASILSSMAAVSATLFVMSTCLSVLSGVAKGDLISIAAAAGSIIVVSGAMVILAEAFKMMADVPWQNIMASLAVIAGMAIVFGVLGAVAGTVPQIAAGLIIVALAFDLFSLSAIGFGYGIDILSDAINKLVGIDLLGIAGGLSAIAGAGLLLGLASVTMILVGPAFMLAAAGVEALGLAIGVAAPIIASSMTIISDAFEHTVDTLLNTGEKLVDAGKNALQGFINGITNNSLLSKIFKSGEDAGKKFDTGLRGFLKIHSPSVLEKENGKFTVQGLIDGMKSKFSEIFHTGEQAGENADNGIANGILGNIGSIDEALSSVSSYMEDKLNSIFSEFSIDTDFEDKLNDFLHITEESDDKTESAANSADKFASSLGGVGKAAKEAKTPLEELTDKIAGQIDIFSEFSAKEDITGEKMLQNMRSQIAGVNKWATNLQILAARGIDQGLLQKLTELGPAGYEKVAAFTQMTQDQLAEANVLFAQSLILPKATATLLTGSYSNVGKDLTQGFVDGINEHAADEKMYNLGDNGLKELKESTGVHSPSIYAYEIGVNLVRGLMNGMGSLENGPINKSIIIGSNIIKTLNNYINTSKGNTIGKNLMIGINNGIVNQQSTVINNVMKMANNVVASAKKAFGVHSPSVIFEKIGNFLDMGLINGINEMSGRVINSAETLADKTISGFQEASNGISRVIDWDMDLNPVITPTLDLSSIESDAGSINSIFGRQQVAAYAMDNGLTASQQSALDILSNKLSASLGDILLNQPNTPVEVNVSLEGDADGIFRVVKMENQRVYKQTGRSPLVY